MIKQFQFIDPALGAAQDTLAQILVDLGDLKAKPDLPELESMSDRVASAQRDIDGQLRVVEGDLQKIDGLDASRFRDVSAEDEKATREEWARLKEARERLLSDHVETSKTLGEIRAELKPETSDKAMAQLVSLAVHLDNLVKELSLVQARARLEIITVDALDLHPLEALAISRANRVDWMNNRATLVDTWRLIEFNANALESGLDIIISGDVGTTGSNPTDFNRTTGNLRAGLRFDGPFTRLNERNIYRAQLIAYQQARRRLIQFEDGVHQRLRANLRQLSQQRANLEIQRRAMAIAIRRVDERRENLNKPVTPAAPGATAQQFGPTAARDLLDALSDLRSVQNNVMSVWLAYYASHMTLIRDLGVMQLDENGMWVAQPLDQFERMGPDECLLPPAIPDQWFKDLDAVGQPEAVPATGPNGNQTPPAPAAVRTSTTPDVSDARKSESGAAINNQQKAGTLGRRPRALNAKAVSEAKVIQTVEATQPTPKPLPAIVPRDQVQAPTSAALPAVVPASTR